MMLKTETNNQKGRLKVVSDRAKLELALSRTLTLDELKVLEFIAEGFPSEEIAEFLNLNEISAKRHIASILRKLKARSRAHAIAICFRTGCLVMEWEK